MSRRNAICTRIGIDVLTLDNKCQKAHLMYLTIFEWIKRHLSLRTIINSLSRHELVWCHQELASAFALYTRRSAQIRDSFRNTCFLSFRKNIKRRHWYRIVKLSSKRRQLYNSLPSLSKLGLSPIQKGIFFITLQWATVLWSGATLKLSKGDILEARGTESEASICCYRCYWSSTK